MGNEEKKALQPSTEDMHKFYTTEQVKQELELFMDERGLATIGVGHIPSLNHDGDSRDDHILISSSQSSKCAPSCPSECADKPSTLLFMYVNTESGKYGCSGYQLDTIKMLVERIYCRGIKLYRECDSITYSAWSKKLSLGFWARDYTVCDLRLDVTFESHHEREQQLTVEIYSEGRRSLLDELTSSWIPCMMSVGSNNSPSLFTMPLSSIDAVEISYAHAVTKVDDISREIHIYGETFRCLFWLLRNYCACGGFRPNKKPDILYQVHRNYEMFKKSYLASDAYSTVETFLLQVLERSSVEVFSVNYSLSHLSILFAVNGRGFVCCMGGGQGIFIEEIGTGNRLAIRQFYSEGFIRAEESRICDFLGIKMPDGNSVSLAEYISARGY